MSEPADRLTDAALRPLAVPPELRQAGLKLLGGMVQASHPGAAAMIARWDRVDGRVRRPLWRRALVVAGVLLAAWVLIGAVGEGMRYKRVLWYFGYHGAWALGTPAESREVVAGDLNEHERFLLFGDLSQHSRSGQMQALCISAPENPAYYAAYAFAYRSENQGTFPPDLLETAQRLDPDNSWFTYHAAGALACNAVQRTRQTLAARSAGEAPAWQIVDQEKMNQALALLRLAAGQKRFVNRQQEFIAARVPLLRQSDEVSRVTAAAFILDYFGLDYDLRALSDVAAAQAWMLGEAADAPGFQRLLGDVDAYMKAFGAMSDPTLVEAVVYEANADRLMRNLHAAAGKLGLTAEATRLGRIEAGLEQRAKERDQRLDSPGVAAAKRHCALGTTWSANVSTMVKSLPVISDAELKPGRMVEHLLWSRGCSLAAWFLLGAGLLAVALFRFCLPQAVLRLAQRINQLLVPGDWAWMLGAGVLLPFGYVTALLRCSPLGGQEWGLFDGGAAVVVGADFLTLALLLLVMPVLIARWRLGRRAAALGIWHSRSRLGWLAVTAGALVVPVLGMTALPVTHLTLYLVLRLALLAPLGWVSLVSLARSLAATFTRQLSRAVVALTLIPTYACAMLVLMASMPVYQAMQARWERRDEMTKLSANGVTRYEGAVANELLKEVREVLELDAGRGVR